MNIYFEKFQNFKFLPPSPMAHCKNYEKITFNLDIVVTYQIKPPDLVSANLGTKHFFLNIQGPEGGEK